MFNLIPEKAIVFYQPDYDFNEEVEFERGIIPEPGSADYVVFIHDLDPEGNPVSTKSPTKEGVHELFKHYFEQVKNMKAKVLTISGANHGRLIRWKVTNNTLFLCWHVPKGIREIRMGEKKMKLFFPDSIFIYGHFGLHIYSYKKKTKTWEDTILYSYHFPHLSSGHLCLGTTRTYIEQQLSGNTDIEDACSIIEGAIFNSKWTHGLSDKEKEQNQDAIKIGKFKMPLKKADKLNKIVDALFSRPIYN